MFLRVMEQYHDGMPCRSCAADPEPHEVLPRGEYGIHDCTCFCTVDLGGGSQPKVTPGMRYSNIVWVLASSLAASAWRHATTVEGFVSSPVPLRHSNTSPWQSGVKRARGVRMFFGGPSGVMPKLYDGWFKKTRQIEKDIVASAKSALRCDKLHNRDADLLAWNYQHRYTDC